MTRNMKSREVYVIPRRARGVSLRMHYPIVSDSGIPESAARMSVTILLDIQVMMKVEKRIPTPMPASTKA